MAPFSQPAALDLNAPERVLVFAPHPDDETLGCGGTLAALARRCSVRVALVTDGSGGGELPAGTAEARQREFHQALELLGIRDLVFFNQSDGSFVADGAFEDRVRKLLLDFAPDWVFLPSPIDYHRDHLRITDCVIECSRGLPSLKHLVFYEVWAPVPATHIVDITADLPLKVSALAAHSTSMAYGDYERAIIGLNRYRGLYLGRERFAEAFLVIRLPHDVHLLEVVRENGYRLIEAIGAAK